MTVYNFNLGIGWASSGVEYAQMYRAISFRNIKQDAKFIFMDMIKSENIAHLTANIGFKDEEVIWLYQYFSDIKIAPTTFTIEQVLDTLDYEPNRKEESGNVVRYFYDSEDMFVTMYLKEPEKNIVDRAEFVSRDCLIRKDYYSYTRVFSEYYTPKDGRAHLYQRRFFNEDGTTAYEEIIDGDADSIFRFPDKILYSKEEFIAYFVKKLNLTKNDLILMDRATEIGQAIFENFRPAKIGTIVHADHYSDNAIDDNYILWNNYYEYEFMNADVIDIFITSTDAQTNLLREQFRKYTPFNPKVVTVPVGNLTSLVRPKEKRKPFSLITASRLATEKHIDWLVNAVIIAKKYIPELQFDIYGNGGERSKLEKIIKENNAGEYIHLKGHQKLDNIYSQYEVYVSASTSEGFGLTLLEAIGSGLPIIGFDVPYGNPTFVKEGINGYLIDKEDDAVDSEVSKVISEKIVKIFKEANLEKMHEASYKKASEYLSTEIDKMWKKTIEEVLND